MAEGQRKKRREWAIALALFAGVFCVHFASGVSAGGDSRWVIPTAVSLYREGDADLNEYPDLLEDWSYYCTDEVDGRYYSFFPLGSTLMALPFVYPVDAILTWTFDRFPSLEQAVQRMSPRPLPDVNVITVASRVEWLPACFVVALTAMLTYLVGRHWLDRRWALALALLFAFATPAWSTASRAMLQHGPMMLVLTLTLWLFVKAEERPWVVQFTGAVLAFGYVIRPTGSIPLALLSFYVLVKHRRYVVPYGLWTLAVLIPLFVYYYFVYGTPLPPYYRVGRLGATPFFWEALAGNLVSPARGLLLFTPLFLFSLAGTAIQVRRGRFGLLDGLLWGIVVLHWLAISGFWHWWGGHSYGPRYFSDVTPVFIYFLIPVLQEFQERAGRFREWSTGRRAYAAGCALCALFSFFVHLRGATDIRTYDWNWDPVEIDTHKERLWDWSDPQFLRGLLPRDESARPPTPTLRGRDTWIRDRIPSAEPASPSDMRKEQP